MKHLGYGVLLNGKPLGIWPKPWSRAVQYAKKEQGGPNRVEIVPIYIGAPIRYTPTLSLKNR